MARIAIISDIHANYHALSAVVEDVLAMQCTGVVCLGDVVGYNAYPAACLDYVRDLNCAVVKGNHDNEVVSAADTNMNPIARQAMEWTRKQLSSEQVAWLARLNYQRLVPVDHAASFTIVHSSLDQPRAWNYIMNSSDAFGHFTRQVTPLCFHGHSHVPRIFVSDGTAAVELDEPMAALRADGYCELRPESGLKYAINVGSVGQPRDGDPRACYAIYDSDRQLVIHKRVSYDIAAAQDAIRAAGLPDYLAERLARGS